MTRGKRYCSDIFLIVPKNTDNNSEETKIDRRNARELIEDRGSTFSKNLDENQKNIFK